MRGQPFAFSGQHYEVHPVDFMPPPAPVQRPRVPVWVVTWWIESDWSGGPHAVARHRKRIDAGQPLR